MTFWEIFLAGNMIAAGIVLVGLLVRGRQPRITTITTRKIRPAESEDRDAANLIGE
jgi:hypothetical protein